MGTRTWSRPTAGRGRAPPIFITGPAPFSNGRGVGADGSIAEPRVFKVKRFPHYMAFADFTGDAHEDVAIVCAGDDTLVLLAGDGKGNLRKLAEFPTGVNPHPVIAGDFTGDGRLDLIVGNRSTKNLTILKGDGTGQFTRLPDVKVPDDPIVLGGGDFNEDGKPDLVLVFASLHRAAIYLGDGRGGFTPAAAAASRPARQ